MRQTLATAAVCAPTIQPQQVIGIDLGDRWSRYCVVDQAGTVVEEDRVRTTPEALAAEFGDLPATRIVIEVSNMPTQKSARKKVTKKSAKRTKRTSRAQSKRRKAA